MMNMVAKLKNLGAQAGHAQVAKADAVKAGMEAEHELDTHYHSLADEMIQGIHKKDHARVKTVLKVMGGHYDQEKSDM